MDELLEKTVDLEELEDILGVSKSTIYKLVNEGWLPKPVSGQWNFL